MPMIFFYFEFHFLAYNLSHIKKKDHENPHALCVYVVCCVCAHACLHGCVHARMRAGHLNTHQLTNVYYT